MRKVLHTILKRGDILKSPTGQKEWIVVDADHEELLVASISSYRTIKSLDSQDWNLLESEECHKLKK